MSGRALLSIGCDIYDHLDRLTGAEADATSIFHWLSQMSATTTLHGPA